MAPETTGHAEVIKIVFDPARVSYRELLEIFFTIHDPTTVDRQGNDVGPQYRSAIFPIDADQRYVAGAYLAQLEAAGVYAGPIQTTIEDMDTFFVAETHHHDYAARNPGQPYIQYVSMPKVEKLLRYFPAISSSA